MKRLVHLMIKAGKVACGVRWSNKVHGTFRPRRVTCTLCRNTQEYRKRVKEVSLGQSNKP